MKPIRIAGMGDNVVDCYQALGLMFPGGNALNTAVFARRLGAETAYVGAVSDDPAGRAIRTALLAEGVDIGRLRILPGTTAWCRIGHENGDRVFVGYDLGVSMFTPAQEDFAFIAGFDATHLGRSSGLDEHLTTIQGKSLLSYDFSTRLAHPGRDRILPLCFLASFSGGGLSDAEAAETARAATAQGARWALVTRGARGAVLAGPAGVVETAAVPTDVVDTLGAGDTMIASVLVGLLRDEDPESILADGARRAAATCRVHGAFGHGVPIDIAS